MYPPACPVRMHWTIGPWMQFTAWVGNRHVLTGDLDLHNYVSLVEANLRLKAYVTVSKKPRLL